MNKDSIRSIISSLICIVGGLFIGFLVLLFLAIFESNIDISEAFKGLRIIIGGPFASGNVKSILFNLGDMILETAPLMLTGLSVAVAFKTGLFNIGASGQYLMGAMGSLIVALSFKTDNILVAFLVWILAFLVGTLLGAIWGMIPGLLKAYYNINEVIVCIMTNWIAANVVSWVFSASGEKFINYAETKTKFLRKPMTSGVGTINFGLDKLLAGSALDISIIIAIVIAIIIFIMMEKTTFGYELKASGFNRNAAKYAGMNEKRNIILSMTIAGALSAAGACLWYLNNNNEFMWNTYSALPQEGFNGIPCALLASNNPLGVIFSALFLRYITKSGFNLAGYTSFNEYVPQLIIAVIIYFAGFSKLIFDILSSRDVKKQMGIYKAKFKNKKDKKVEEEKEGK